MKTFTKIFHGDFSNKTEYEIAKVQREANAEVISTSVANMVTPGGTYVETIVVVFEKIEE